MLLERYSIQPHVLKNIYCKKLNPTTAVAALLSASKPCGPGWGGGGVGGGEDSCPPGPFEPEKSSLWMYLFCLDSVILIVVTCNNCLPFSSWRHLYRLVSQMSCSIVKCLVY